MCFLIKDKKLPEKNNKIWNKASNVMKTGFDSGPVYNEKCWKTKTKFYDGKNHCKFSSWWNPRIRAKSIVFVYSYIDSLCF